MKPSTKYWFIGLTLLFTALYLSQPWVSKHFGSGKIVEAVSVTPGYLETTAPNPPPTPTPDPRVVFFSQCLGVSNPQTIADVNRILPFCYTESLKK